MEKLILRCGKCIKGKGLALCRALALGFGAPHQDILLYLLVIIQVQHLEFTAVTAPCKQGRLCLKYHVRYAHLGIHCT